MSRRDPNQGFWKSYADLSMGLVGVLALLLILLLIKAQAASRELEAERGEFAKELIRLFDESEKIIDRQDMVNDWLSNVFSEGTCQLSLTRTGQLTIRSEESGPAQLYDPGSVALQREAEAALRSCLENFRRLAICLSSAPGAREQCEAMDQGTEFEELSEVRREFREGIEALVLQGNTDRQRYYQAPPVVSFDSWYRLEESLTENFTENAYLGAERARQALAHLLRLVEGEGTDTTEPAQILMSRVRIESPSFGRYQAGPTERDNLPLRWREGKCSGVDCPEARNLSLLLRWRKEALRRPFMEIRNQFCRLLEDPDSALFRGIEDPEVTRQRLCESP